LPTPLILGFVYFSAGRSQHFRKRREDLTMPSTRGGEQEKAIALRVGDDHRLWPPSRSAAEIRRRGAEEGREKRADRDRREGSGDPRRNAADRRSRPAAAKADSPARRRGSPPTAPMMIASSITDEDRRRLPRESVQKRFGGLVTARYARPYADALLGSVPAISTPQTPQGPATWQRRSSGGPRRARTLP
jgi:hypothetical protein